MILTAARRIFALDPRSLALLRIGLGLTILLELIVLLPDVPAFFTDAGLLPRDACARLTAGERGTFPPYWVSPYMLSGDAAWTYTLFGLTAGFAVALALGWRTRLAAVGTWALLVGLQARNPLVFYGSDAVVRCALFWALFLPLGARWSLDARGRPTPAGPVVSLASAGLLVQLACLYLETGLVKSDPMWREDGSALYHALATDLFTSPFGRALTDYPGLLRFLTVATVGLEVIGPLLLFVPFGGWVIRTLVVAGFVGLHLGIAATMDIGLFPYACLACWAGVLPGGFWDAVLGRPPTGAPPAGEPLSLPGRAVLAGLIGFVVLAAFTRTRHDADTPVAEPLATLGRAAHLDQSWYMFAPRPYNFSGWFDVHGTLADGTKVSVLEPGGPPRDRPPARGSDLWPSMPWRRIPLDLCEIADCPNLRAGSADYFRRRWDDAHPDRPLAAIEIVAVMTPTPAPGEPRDWAQTQVLVLARWDQTAGHDQPRVPFVRDP